MNHPCNLWMVLSSFTSPLLNLAWAVHVFIHHRIAFVKDRGRPGDSYVQLIGNVEIDSGNAVALDNAARSVKIVSVDLTGAVRVDVDELGGSRYDDRGCPIRIDLKLLIVHALDFDLSRP